MNEISNPHYFLIILCKVIKKIMKCLQYRKRNLNSMSNCVNKRSLNRHAGCCSSSCCDRLLDFG